MGSGNNNNKNHTMDHVLLALGETREERDVRIRSLFNFFDGKNKEYLDYGQIESGLSALKIPPEYKYARELFKVCDSNSDGRVTYHEFRRYMDDKELELYRIFQAIDVEHSGSILPEELWDALVKAGGVFYSFSNLHISVPCYRLLVHSFVIFSCYINFLVILIAVIAFMFVQDHFISK